jgi:hypothetical protein
VRSAIQKIGHCVGEIAQPAALAVPNVHLAKVDAGFGRAVQPLNFGFARKPIGRHTLPEIAAGEPRAQSRVRQFNRAGELDRREIGGFIDEDLCEIPGPDCFKPMYGEPESRRRPSLA